MFIKLAHLRDCILMCLPHVIARAGARVSKKWVIHVKLKSWLRPLESTFPYLKVNLISSFLHIPGWLGLPSIQPPSCPLMYDWLGWSEQVRAILAKDPEISWNDFPGNQVPEVEGGDKRYSIISVFVCSLTLDSCFQPLIWSMPVFFPL